MPNPPVAEDPPVADDPVATALPKQHLACSLFGQDLAIERGPLMSYLKYFSILGKPEQEAYLTKIATARLGAAGVGTPQAPPFGTVPTLQALGVEPAISK